MLCRHELLLHYPHIEHEYTRAANVGLYRVIVDGSDQDDVVRISVGHSKWSNIIYFTRHSVCLPGCVINPAIIRLAIPTYIFYPYCLYFVFLPRINSTLKGFVESWNNHSLSATHNLTPNQLYICWCDHCTAQ